MVERSLSMREVPGSIPGASTTFEIFLFEPLTKKSLHRPGIEPGPPAWQASILPLNQRCSLAAWSVLTRCIPDKIEQQQEKGAAVGRIRTYARRAELISSQSP